MSIGSGGYRSSEGSWTLIGSDTKALVFCENGELCKTVKAKAGRPRDENRPCGWNAGGQVVQGFKCLGENKIHRWSEASMGVAVTTGSQLAVHNVLFVQ